MVTGRGKLSRAFSPSLEDCPGAPNNRWPWASAALPACGQACARSRPGGAGSVGGCCRRSWLAVSNSERKNEAPASTSGRGLSPLRPLPVWESGRRRYLSHILGPNSFLVARSPSADLLICAKDLFGEATAAVTTWLSANAPGDISLATHQSLRR